MSWSRRLRTVAALALALALGAPALGTLGGCGLEPVYGKASRVRHPELAAIEVGSIPSRTGQELRNHLIEGLGSGRRTALYRLDVVLSESRTELAVQADDKVTRFNLGLIASLSLVDLKTGKPLYSTATRSVSSYNIVDSEFATVASEKNARSRAAEDLAFSIRDLLIVYFSREPEAEPAAPPVS